MASISSKYVIGESSAFWSESCKRSREFLHAKRVLGPKDIHFHVDQCHETKLYIYRRISRGLNSAVVIGVGVVGLAVARELQSPKSSLDFLLNFSTRLVQGLFSLGTSMFTSSVASMQEVMHQTEREDTEPVVAKAARNLREGIVKGRSLWQLLFTITRFSKTAASYFAKRVKQ
ncbi:hypothetical protein YC2023_064046 [Brassica napus]